MSTDSNEHLVRRLFEEVIDRGNLVVADDLLAPNFHSYFPSSAAPMDRDALKHFITQFRAAFPDARHQLDELITAGNRTVARYTVRATHRGTFQGMAPSGKPITFTGISIYRIQDNHIIDEYGEADLLGLQQQLGRMPT